MADNESLQEQYVRLGTRIFENEEQVTTFLSSYGGGAVFIPYYGEKIVVNSSRSGPCYKIGDGETVYDNLIPSKSLHKVSVDAEDTEAPDYIDGIANLLAKIENMENSIKYLQDRVRDLEDLPNQVILKSNIPKGLILSFANDVTSDQLKEAFGENTNWNSVSGYLKGISVETSEEPIGFQQGATTITISEMPRHSHVVTVNTNDYNTTEVGKDINNDGLATVEYTPNTFTMKAFKLWDTQEEDTTTPPTIEPAPEDPSEPVPEEPSEPPSGTETPEPEPDAGETEKTEIGLIYQGRTEGNKLGTITNYNPNDLYGYAGILGTPLQGIRVAAAGIDLKYRVRTHEGSSSTWGDEITVLKGTTDFKNSSLQFQPTTMKNIDGFMITSLTENIRFTYRAHARGKGWLNSITDYNTTNLTTGHAGWPGYVIDAIAIKAEYIGG